MRDFVAFLRAHLPPPPARVLEVGAGSGELTTALAVAGYDVVGIDPLAPHGDRFRRLKLEDLDDEEEPPRDAVVAARSLHPIRDLEAAVDKIERLLRPGGVVAVEELAWERADEPTLAWLLEQRRAAAEAGGPAAPASVAELREEWEADRVGSHTSEPLLSNLRGRFEELAYEPAPFLHRLLGSAGSVVLEQALIDAGAIRALGFRFAGRRR